MRRIFLECPGGTVDLISIGFASDLEVVTPRLSGNRDVSRCLSIEYSFNCGPLENMFWFGRKPRTLRSAIRQDSRGGTLRMGGLSRSHKKFYAVGGLGASPCQSADSIQSVVDLRRTRRAMRNK